MRKALLILAVMAFAMVMQSRDRSITIGVTAVADTTVTNPNGSSELAQLMRDMQQYTSDARKAVLEGKAPATYPKDFDRLHTAAMTKGMSKSEHYNAFADMYIANVKSYATSTSKNRLSAYNNMVTSCISCHSQHCPGPTPMIKKLLIPTESK